MTRNYELTFIIKPDTDATNLAALLEKVKDTITAEGGSIVKVDQWGLRRLMYPIRKYREGQYVYELLKLEANSVARIEARLHLMEDVIRYLFIRADDNLPEPPAPAAEAAPVTEQTVTSPASDAPAAPEATTPVETSPETTTP
ncbi:MAG TPA: 30S ribosomal protein S6 [Anaerolineae bacterium]